MDYRTCLDAKESVTSASTSHTLCIFSRFLFVSDIFDHAVNLFRCSSLVVISKWIIALMCFAMIVVLLFCLANAFIASSHLD